MDGVPALLFVIGLVAAIAISVVLLRLSGNRLAINLGLYATALALQAVALLLVPSMSFVYLRGAIDIDVADFYASPMAALFPLAAIVAFAVADGIMVVKRFWKA
ncbi:hypothetical protein [Bifidobacterium sp. UTBIF-78]|uniref:hypothetical protein n=1 Tax=Bifidobacterium sp. UTBIF-78 TaxID=1465263 RepID=UPI001127E9A3|nr:hypothetical protein [Bifidobacterium sp. UTBIF-78]TPF95965.1 hypothetical protein BG22_00385 [Bifidobacterium sp. UTBIF-78]